MNIVAGSRRGAADGLHDLEGRLGALDFVPSARRLPVREGLVQVHRPAGADRAGRPRVHVRGQGVEGGAGRRRRPEGPGPHHHCNPAGPPGRHVRRQNVRANALGGSAYLLRQLQSYQRCGLARLYLL